MGIVTTNGKLADAIQRLDRLAERLNNRENILFVLADDLLLRLGETVVPRSMFGTGTLSRALQQYTITSRNHVSIGDAKAFQRSFEDAPEGTIGAFLRYMLEQHLGFMAGRRGHGKRKGEEKKAKLQQQKQKRVTKKLVKQLKKEGEVEQYRSALHKVFKGADLSSKEEHILEMYPAKLAKKTYQGKRFGYREQREWAFAELGKLKLRDKDLLKDAKWYIEEVYADKAKKESEISKFHREMKRVGKLQSKIRSEYEVTDAALDAAIEATERAARRKKK